MKSKPSDSLGVEYGIEEKSLRHVAMVAKFNPKGPYLLKFRKKENENICVVFTYSMKRAREIRKFHVAVHVVVA